MVRQARWGAVHGLLVLCLGGIWWPACGQNAGADAVYHLRGRVVNGQTGQPIERALVASTDRRLATLTNSEGRFDIEVSVPAQPNGGGPGMRSLLGLGNIVSLGAQKPGFVPQPQFLDVSLDDTVSSKEITLKLMPDAVITGLVSTPSSDSPWNVRLMLLRHQVQDGRMEWLPAGSHATNSHGEFRFANLAPGEYTIVSTEYRGGENVPRRPNVVTRAYPPTYYGDAGSITAASKLTLHYGETAHAELHLEPATYYPVTIAVAQPVNGVIVQVAGPQRFTGAQLSYNARDGAIEGSLPDGSYTLIIFTFGQQQQQGFARVPIQVAGAPVHAGPVTLAPPGSVEVHVNTEFTGEQASVPVNTRVSLRDDDFGMGFAQGGSGPGHEDEFTLQNVRSGQYHVEVYPSHGYVAALTSGGTDLLREPLVVSASGTAPEIEVTLRDDGATVTGRVNAGDDPVPSRSFVELIPDGDDGQFATSFAGADGKFTFQNVPPGTYRLLATTERALQIPYRDPEAMRGYDGKGSTITVSAGQSMSSDAPLVDLDGGEAQ